MREPPAGATAAVPSPAAPTPLVPATEFAEPASALRRYVRRYVQFLAPAGAGPAALRVAAHHRAFVLVTWAEPVSVPAFPAGADVVRSLTLSAPTTRWWDALAAGAVGVFIVQFATGGLRAVFGGPASAGVDRVDDLLAHAHARSAPALRAWEEQVAGARSFGHRVALTDRMLLGRLRLGTRVPAPVELVRWAVEEVERTGGQARVDALAAAAGTSGRTLRRAARAELGMSLKRCARIVRAQRSLRLLQGPALAPAPRVAAVAARCGYSDQAHLVRDFHELVGALPGAVDPVLHAHERALLGAGEG